MRFALMQIALGLAILWLAAMVGEWAWALAWPGWSVLVVGVAYLGPFGPKIFGKDAANGRLRRLNVVILFPYYVVAWTLWQLKSRLSGENAHDEVAPGIFVGRRPLADGEVPTDTRVVIDLTSEFPRSRSTLEIERYVCVPTLDTTAPDDDAFSTLLETLSDEEGPIFVHCAMGHGRSATVAAGLMIRRGIARDVDDAVQRMTNVRPGVHLHDNQRDAVTRVS